MSKTGVSPEASWRERRRKARLSGSVQSDERSSRRRFVAWAKESSPVSCCPRRAIKGSVKRWFLYRKGGRRVGASTAWSGGRGGECSGPTMTCRTTLFHHFLQICLTLSAIVRYVGSGMVMVIMVYLLVSRDRETISLAAERQSFSLWSHNSSVVASVVSASNLL